jgi:hypothetical protein
MQTIIDTDDKLTFYYQGSHKASGLQIIKSLLENRGHDLVDYYDEFLVDIYILHDNKKSKYIAIDWDNTIGADPEFFKQMIVRFKESGYEPCICSLRQPDKESWTEITDFLESTSIPIYLTDGRSKRRYLKKLGLKIHLWIDDFYPGISRDSSKLFTNNNIE